MQTKLKQLIGIPFAEGVEGIGSCGFQWDEEGNFTGYLYASHGFGNMESYWGVKSLLERYPELGDLSVCVYFNESGEILSLNS